MDKSLLEIEKSLKQLKMPEASDTALWRLEDLVDELANEEVNSLDSSQLRDTNSEDLIYKIQQQPRLLFYSIAACFLACIGAGFYGFEKAAQRTSHGMEAARGSASSAQSESAQQQNDFVPVRIAHTEATKADTANTAPMSMEFVRSDTVVEVIGVEEGFSEDRNAFFRVERYSVLDSDVYKDTTSGHTVTLQQTSNEERRAPVTFF